MPYIHEQTTFPHRTFQMLSCPPVSPPRPHANPKPKNTSATVHLQRIRLEYCWYALVLTTLFDNNKTATTPGSRSSPELRYQHTFRGFSGAAAGGLDSRSRSQRPDPPSPSPPPPSATGTGGGGPAAIRTPPTVSGAVPPPPPVPSRGAKPALARLMDAELASASKPPLA